jgi:Flp pilus assembly protein TadG
MTDVTAKAETRGFLKRLARDEAGNTIAIMAAAVIPTIGLIGGGVDMSRIYLAKTTLQAACDAGSLMGRKSMASGAWSDNTFKARTDANAMFDANFTEGAYGTKNLVRNYSENGAGNVSGTASVDVPMSLMKALGNDTRNVRVTCQSELRIPNTDVMFVLDTTGSMDSAIAGSGSSASKISGLKIAVKCFYEALAKEDITDITPAQCGETQNPSGGNSANVQLRFGFVPYSVNVNVGKLLPLDFMADTWSYQSRRANFDANAGWTATYGAATNTTQTSSNTTNNNGSGNSWSNVNNNMTIGGTLYYYRFNMNNKNQSCASYVANPPTQSTNANGSPTFVSQSPANPVYPQASVLRNYQTQNTTGSQLFQYFKSGSSGGRECRLQTKWGASSTTTIMSQSTVPITWKQNIVFQNWTYKKVAFDVSDLKNENANAWNNSVTLPLGTNGASTSVAWAGCIEERKTLPLTDTDPSDDWNPIPDEALDMDIDLVPDVNDPDTQWGPALPNAVWLRKNGVARYFYYRDWPDQYYDGYGSPVLADKTTTNHNEQSASGSNCPTTAKRYQSWSADGYKNYVNSLSTGGNTYHDIGLLWGARLMSPSGIFADDNAPADTIIQRHMVFMTDGDTSTYNEDYTPYGVGWYDRRQTDAASPPSYQLSDGNVNARTVALCQAIKNKNITLWVVSYGGTGSGGISAATNARLQACASDGHFLTANSVSQLANAFKGIASEISNLRLTN